MQLENHLMLWLMLILHLFVSTEAEKTAFEKFVNEFKNKKARIQFKNWLGRLPWSMVEFYCKKYNFGGDNPALTFWHRVEGANFQMLGILCDNRKLLVLSKTQAFYVFNIDANYILHFERILPWEPTPEEILYIEEENRIAYPIPLP